MDDEKKRFLFDVGAEYVGESKFSFDYTVVKPAIAFVLVSFAQDFLVPSGNQTVDDKSAFSDNSVRSSYRPGQFLRMFLRPVNGYRCAILLSVPSMNNRSIGFSKTSRRADAFRSQRGLRPLKSHCSGPDCLKPFETPRP
jgi:hypothetical protein